MRKIHTLSRLLSLLAMTFLWLCSPVALAQHTTAATQTASQRTVVTGQVKDEQGMPLPGVCVLGP